jgi:hypothetical protein
VLKSAGWVFCLVLLFWVMVVSGGIALWVLAALLGKAAYDPYDFLWPPVHCVGMLLIYAGPVALSLGIGYHAPAVSGRGPMLSVVFGVVTALTWLPIMYLDMPSWVALLAYSLAIAAGASLGGFLPRCLVSRRQRPGRQTPGPTPEGHEA